MVVQSLIFDLVEIELLHIQQRRWIVDFIADENHEVADFLLDLLVWKVGQIYDFLNAVVVQDVLFRNYFEHFLEDDDRFEHDLWICGLLFTIFGRHGWLSQPHEEQFLFLEALGQLSMINI